MATIKEDYVSFETAKLLKEKGFEIDTERDYWKIGNDGTMYFMSSIGAYTDDPNYKYAFYRPKDSYPCPTQQMAMRWLREVHNIDIIAPPQYDNVKWTYSAIIFKLSIPCTEIRLNDNKDKKEEACESAIKYCLENLI